MGAAKNAEEIPEDVRRQGRDACRRMGWSESWADDIADAIWRGILKDRKRPNAEPS